MNAARAAIPFLVFLPALVAFGQRGRSLRGWSPAHLWVIYGALAFGWGLLADKASLLSTTYWGAAYVGALLVACGCVRRGGDEVAAAETVNWVTWAVTTIVIVVLTVVARDVLIEGSGLEASGYGSLNRMPEVAGMAMSRATGMARWAAVPGIVALGMAMCRAGIARWIGVIVYLGAAVFLYLMQSRGATAGYLGATLFVLWCSGRWGKAGIVICVLAVGGALAMNLVPPEVIDHLTRGESAQDLENLTGRTRAWDHAWSFITLNPLTGYGFEADRWLIGEHVHNTYMYALVAAGLPGLALFVGGLAWSWVQFAKVLVHPALKASGQKMTLIQVGGVLAFFTLRSIPEVCGANYAVDYLVMLPAIVYIHVLHRRLTKPAGAV
jgi:O-antigen ligase